VTVAIQMRPAHRKQTQARSLHRLDPPAKRQCAETLANMYKVRQMFPGLEKQILSMLSMFVAECERLPTRGGNTMGLGDKIENAAEKAGGKGKEAAGNATGGENLKAEGQADQAKGDVKQAGEKVKDAFKD
jgi:uncharacterized protein YjbJ (UPF0337 family)